MNFPQKLGGGSAIQNWLNRLLEAVKSSEVVNSRDILVERTPNGTKLAIRPQSGGGSGGTYHAIKLCRNGQEVTINFDTQEDPSTTPDDA